MQYHFNPNRVSDKLIQNKVVFLSYNETRARELAIVLVSERETSTYNYVHKREA